MYNPIPFQPTPVTKGQEINATIDDIGSRGDEITRIQNFLIFVPQAKIGEHLNVKNVKVTKKFAIAGKIKQNEEEKMKINELRDGMRRVSVVAKVIEKSEPREVRSRYRDETYRVADAIISDETGKIKLTLWNQQIDQVNIDDTVKIENGYIRSFRGEIQLNVGKYGTLTIE